MHINYTEMGVVGNHRSQMLTEETTCTPPRSQKCTVRTYIFGCTFQDSITTSDPLAEHREINSSSKQSVVAHLVIVPSIYVININSFTEVSLNCRRGETDFHFLISSSLHWFA